jgi:diacylglycerol kinase (ATP)
MSGRTRALMLVNPGARRGAQALEVVPHLDQLGLEVSVEQFASAAEVTDDIVRRAPGFDLVIVCGGDGTIASAAVGVLETGLPLGILPLGTANDLARTLGIDPDPVAAAGLIVAGNTRRIDLGEVNGHPFFNVASIGFSAELARELTAEAKRKWGVFGYAVTAMRLLISMRPFRAWIDHDGTTEAIRTVQVSAGNGRH